MPSESHAKLYALQIGKIADLLRRALGDETLQVTSEVREEAFPELELLQTSQERWEALRQMSPLAEVLLRRAKGQVIPKDIQAYLQREEEEGTSQNK